MKTSAIALAVVLAPAMAQAADTIHGNTFLSEDSYQSVLSDVRAGGRVPTAVQPGMGSGDSGPAATTRLSPRGRNPELDGSVLYDVGIDI